MKLRKDVIGKKEGSFSADDFAKECLAIRTILQFFEIELGRKLFRSICNKTGSAWGNAYIHTHDEIERKLVPILLAGAVTIESEKRYVSDPSREPRELATLIAILVKGEEETILRTFLKRSWRKKRLREAKKFLST